MTAETLGFPFVVWCGVLGVIMVVALTARLRQWRHGRLARPVPGRVVRIQPRANTSGGIGSLMAEVAVTDALGNQSVVRTFPKNDTGGIWLGRELTLWQRPGAKTPPRLIRPGRQEWPGRYLTIAGSAFAALVVVVAVRVAKIDQNSVAVLKPAGIAVAAYSAVAVVVTLARLIATRRILHGIPVPGQVIGLVKQQTTNQDNTTSTTYRPIVAFTAADGRQVFGLASTSGSLRRRWAGRTVQIRHEPGRPESFRLAKPSEAWGYLSNVLFSLFMVAAGFAATAYALRRQ
ncbi:MAG TPA: DUF3592 domain-containing protein [Actinocrinis sp.]|nr:DUF3592 domain-containing protein [Actinocrinis sp.]